jgi:competence protein ComEA
MSDSGARPEAATGDGVLLVSDRVAVDPRQGAVEQLPEAAVDDAVERGPSARVRVAVGAALVLVVVALVASVLVTALSPVGATTVFGENGDDGATAGSSGPDRAVGGSDDDAAGSNTGALPPSPDAPDSGGDASMGESRAAILVHVLGSVLHPGVYELAEGSRAVDAVTMAGGFAEGAEQASLNLARPLVDGEQLRVLAVGEAPPAVSGAAGSGGGGSGSPSSGAPAGSSGPAGGSPVALINLNSATALDLDTLPRIGPAMATRIITWRDENGPFASVDDLLQITGIGDKTFESLRPLVTV